MKKTLLFIAMFAITISGFSQFTGSVNPKPILKNQEKSAKTTVGQLAYSTTASAEGNLGQASPNFTVFAYFDVADVSTYSGNVINKISFACNPAGFSGDVTVLIWTDTTGWCASPAYTQTVPLSSLVNGWNDVILTTPYAITGTTPIAFGFSASSTAGGGFKYDNSALAANEKGSYYVITAYQFDGNLGTGNAGEYLNWNLMATVDDGVSADDAQLTALTIPNPTCDLSNNEQIVATVKNNGTTVLSTPFNLGYVFNGGAEVTVAVPTPIAIGASVNVTFNIDLSADGFYTLKAYTKLSSDSDLNNDTLETSTANTVPNTIPMSVLFDVTTYDFIGWNNEDVNNDGSSWGIYNISTLPAGAHSGDIGALYQYNTTNAANDYMYSNCIDLTAGNYTLKFWTVVDATYPEKLSVKIGQGQTPSAMTSTIVDLGTISNDTWTETTANFTIATSGTYNLGFYAYSDADMDFIALDDVSIEVATSLENTVANSEVNVYPNPTTGIVNITNAENATINVYNQVGSLVKTATNVNSIDLSDVANGTYIVKVTTNSNTIVKNIVLTK